MSSNAFLPQGSTQALSTSTTSASVAMTPAISTTICVTNRSSSNAWVTWGLTAPTAVFPVAGTPQFGLEVPAGVQVTIGTQGQAAFVAAILLSGTGIMTITPGDGL